MNLLKAVRTLHVRINKSHNPNNREIGVIRTFKLKIETSKERPMKISN